MSQASDLQELSSLTLAVRILDVALRPATKGTILYCFMLAQARYVAVGFRSSWPRIRGSWASLLRPLASRTTFTSIYTDLKQSAFTANLSSQGLARDCPQHVSLFPPCQGATAGESCDPRAYNSGRRHRPHKQPGTSSTEPLSDNLTSTSMPSGPCSAVWLQEQLLSQPAV